MSSLSSAGVSACAGGGRRWRSAEGAADGGYDGQQEGGDAAHHLTGRR